jgi:hypothetical protein
MTYNSSVLIIVRQTIIFEFSVRLPVNLLIIIKIANSWIVLNLGGGPTDDKDSQTVWETGSSYQNQNRKYNSIVKTRTSTNSDISQRWGNVRIDSKTQHNQPSSVPSCQVGAYKHGYFTV